MIRGEGLLDERSGRRCQKHYLVVLQLYGQPDRHLLAREWDPLEL
jgi:hypothetical protein